MDSEAKAGLIVFLFVLACLAILFGGIGTCVSTHYGYSRDVRQNLRLADDASDAPTKLKYLRAYRQAVVENIHHNDARYWLRQKQYTRDAQLEILDTLIGRLESMTQMDPKSPEYQFAMQQVSGQEFDNVIDRIDHIFFGCYCREGLWRWFWTSGGAMVQKTKLK